MFSCQLNFVLNLVMEVVFVKAYVWLVREEKIKRERGKNIGFVCLWLLRKLGCWESD